MEKRNILIVGQGLAGTLLSYQLTKNKVQHKVVNQSNTTSASMIAAGMFNPLVFKRLTKSWMIDTLLPEMFQTYTEIEQWLQQKIIHHIPIAKLFAEQEKSWWDKQINKNKLNNYIADFKSTEDTKGIRAEAQLAIIKPGGYIDLKTLIKGYRNLLQQQGCYIEQAFAYKDIILQKDFAIWKGERFSKIIFCEGAAATLNPYFPNIPYYLTKGDILEVEIKNLDENYIYNKDCFLLPKGNHRFILGATYNHQDLNLEAKEEDATYLLNKVKAITNEDITPLKHYCGIRPTTKDRRPILGFHPDHAALGYFNGLGTKGVTLGPYFAKEMQQSLHAPNRLNNQEYSLHRFL